MSCYQHLSGEPEPEGREYSHGDRQPGSSESLTGSHPSELLLTESDRAYLSLIARDKPENIWDGYPCRQPFFKAMFDDEDCTLFGAQSGNVQGAYHHLWQRSKLIDTLDDHFGYKLSVGAQPGDWQGDQIDLLRTSEVELVDFFVSVIHCLFDKAVYDLNLAGVPTLSAGAKRFRSRATLRPTRVYSRWLRTIASFEKMDNVPPPGWHCPNSVIEKFFKKKISHYIIETLTLTYFKDQNSFPRSLAQLPLMDSNTEFHFLLPAHRYFGKSSKPLTHEQWIENRFRALRLLGVFASFAGSLGVALLSMFSGEPSLISKVINLKSRVFGSARADDVIRILRLLPLVIVYVLTRPCDNGALESLNDKSVTREDNSMLKMSNFFSKFGKTWST
ncbi:hypothetical protein EDB80DRAFT_863384 [Ilyonectria destructans]|nr:hypothetical protein EDB80DRAFT_863384 [Ilyonectria destructans]